MAQYKEVFQLAQTKGYFIRDLTCMEIPNSNIKYINSVIITTIYIELCLMQRWLWDKHNMFISLSIGYGYDPKPGIKAETDDDFILKPWYTYFIQKTDDPDVSWNWEDFEEYNDPNNPVNWHSPIDALCAGIYHALKIVENKNKDQL